MSSPHFTLYSTVVGPNGMYDPSLHIIVNDVSSILKTLGSAGWKVAMVLSELGLSYETIFLDFSKSTCILMT